MYKRQVALSEEGEELLKSSGATKVLVSLTHLEAVASAVVVLVSR